MNVIGLLNCVHVIFDSNSIAPVVGMYWLFYNSYTLVMALFFVLGRSHDSKAEMIVTGDPGNLLADHQEWSIRILRASETSVLIRSEIPLHAPDYGEIRFRNAIGEAIALSIKTDHVSQSDSGWDYMLTITDYQGSYDAYLAYLYDRIPDRVDGIRCSLGVYEDLSVNLMKRLTFQVQPSALQARVPIDFLVSWRDQNKYGQLRILEFSYTHLIADRLPSTDDFEIHLAENLVLQCRKARQPAGSHCRLEILNLEDILHSTENYQQILNLLQAKTMEHNEREKNLKAVKRKQQPSTFDFNEVELV